MDLGQVPNGIQIRKFFETNKIPDWFNPIHKFASKFGQNIFRRPILKTFCETGETGVSCPVQPESSKAFWGALEFELEKMLFHKMGSKLC